MLVSEPAHGPPVVLQKEYANQAPYNKRAKAKLTTLNIASFLSRLLHSFTRGVDTRVGVTCRFTPTVFNKGFSTWHDNENYVSLIGKLNIKRRRDDKLIESRGALEKCEGA